MRKSEWRKVTGIFVLYLVVFMAIDIFFKMMNVWDHERPWLFIVSKDVVIAVALTVFLNWKFFRELFKKKARGQQNL